MGGYPTKRYPDDPEFPRPQSTKTTKENDLIDRDWYEVVCSYIEDLVAGGNLPSGTDGQTLRYDSGNALEATSDLTNHSDGTGSSIAVDNDTEGAERIRNIVKVLEGNAVPDANTTYQGTILIIHKAP